MATQTKKPKKKTSAKKEETNRKKTLPSAAKARTASATLSGGKAGPVGKSKPVSSKEPAKKTRTVKSRSTTEAKTAAKPHPAIGKKIPAKAPPTATAAKTTKSFVKSNNKKSTNKQTDNTKPKPSAKTAKPAKAAPKEKPAAKAKTPAKKPAVADKPVAARRGDEARPAKEKAQGPNLTEKNTKPIKSEAAQKVAKSLIQRKVAKKGSGAKAKPPRPIAFTLDEAIEIAKTKPESGKEASGKTKNGNGANKGGAKQPAAKEKPKKDVPEEEVKQENRVLGAASLSDILGYNPSAGPKKSEEEEVPPKFARYYKLLLELREHVLSGLDIHTRDTLKRSSKDDSGDLSSYSQHMADAGTDTFDRDFALSLVSSEQDALYEIEEAIRRIKQGSYGICEITGKPIKKERLLAVPFAKYSLEGQIEYERTHRKSAYRGGAFGDSSEEGVQFSEEDSEE